MDRREFLEFAALFGAQGLIPTPVALQERAGPTSERPAFKVSLAGWSLHRRHFHEGKMPLLDFPRTAREEFGITAIELVNTMFPSPTWSFLQQLLAESEKHQVKILLIMCDAEGDLASADREHRWQAVRNHHKWVDIAAILGCHSIRVNTGGAASDPASIAQCADSLRRLADYAAAKNLWIITENHGGLSSHPPSLLEALRKSDAPNVGTLPDFGNFPDSIDRYQAIAAMMPLARAVSAKCYDFDDRGEETKIDFSRMMKIVLGAGYRGFVGIEFEGDRMSEADGIRAAKKLLDKLSMEPPK